MSILRKRILLYITAPIFFLSGISNASAIDQNMPSFAGLQLGMTLEDAMHVMQKEGFTIDTTKKVQNGGMGKSPSASFVQRLKEGSNFISREDADSIGAIAYIRAQEALTIRFLAMPWGMVINYMEYNIPKTNIVADDLVAQLNKFYGEGTGRNGNYNWYSDYLANKYATQFNTEKRPKKTSYLVSSRPTSKTVTFYAKGPLQRSDVVEELHKAMHKKRQNQSE